MSTRKQVNASAKSTPAAFIGLGVFVLSVSIHAQQPSNLPASAITTTNQSPQTAQQVHVDRLAILNDERNALLRSRAKWEANGDKTVLARIDADVQALDREIASVSKQPVYATRVSGGGTTTKKPSSLSDSAPKVAASEPPLQNAESTAYEGWDVFKNYGNKTSK